MSTETIKHQFKNNFVAIISLIVAIVALSYNTWREESTEKNRNIRTAGFEMLKNLGELQIVVNHTHFQPENMLANPYLGWGHISLISDLSQLLPEPIPATIGKLVKVWGENWDKIKTSETAVNEVSLEIDASRDAVLESIRHLK